MNEAKRIERLIDRIGDFEPGTVSLVGAGPGDGTLVSVRGAVRLFQADVVVYDELIRRELLDLVQPEAQRIPVRARQGELADAKKQVAEVMIKHASSGKHVVRLCMGDPFALGWASEESTYLAEAGIRFEVVPGIADAVGLSATAGIPLTHRGLSRSVAFVTSHENEQQRGEAEFEALAGMETVVLTLEAGDLRFHCEGLIDAGKAASTPAAAIFGGTCVSQQTIIGTIGDIADRVAAEAIQLECTIVIGQVVRLREQLEWFERRPLYGQTIAVTRTPEQAAGLSGALLAQGAEVIEAPAIELADMEDLSQVDGVLRRIATYDWLVLTSANGVDSVFRRLQALGADSRALGGVRIAAVGTATASRLASYGVRADLVPPEAVGESLAQSLIDRSVRGRRILLLRAQVSREHVPVALRAAGAVCDDIAVYRTVCPRSLPAAFLKRFDQGDMDWITLTSPSSFVNLCTLLGADRAEALGRVKLASMGPVTTAAIQDRGYAETCEANPHNVHGLVSAIVAAVNQRSGRHDRVL